MTALSPREREIVLLVGRDGKKWGTVARELDIGLGTVRSYVARIMFKCESNRTPREALTELYWREFHAPDEADNASADISLAD